MLNAYKPEGMLFMTSANREYLSSISGLERAMNEGKILESTALLCDGKMQLHIDLYGIKGIIEREEAVLCHENEPIKDIAVITRVGKPVCFKVLGISIEDGKPVAYLSRRAAQLECMRNYISSLICGDIIQSRVTHLENFGAFVDIGCGISSLLSVDSISVSRISHPSDRLAVGDYIYTVVKSIEVTNNRVFVSMRELLGTWEENAAVFEAGQTVAGIVRSVESYGVFIELTPNLAGLAEIREGTKDRSIAIAGQCAAVYIKSIIPDRMKIKLVMIDACRFSKESGKSGIRYFTDVDKIRHIDSWRYSPSGSAKVIETIFQTDRRTV